MISHKLLDPRARVSRSMRWLLIFLFAMALAMAACGGKSPDQPGAAETVSGVQVAALRAESIPAGASVPGVVRSAKTAEVAARMMGTVTQVAVKAGDRVTAGQLLAQIDDREAAARRSAAQAAAQEAVTAREQAAHALAAAESQAAVAKKTYDRFVYLREQKSVSPQEFDEVEGKHRAAAAGVEQARARQQQAAAGSARAQSELSAAEAVAGYTRVAAPFTGVVVKRMAEPGQMAGQGQPLFIVEEAGRFEFEATIDASGAAQKIRRGTKALVRVDSLDGREWEATVTEMEAGADAATQTLRVKLALPAGEGLQSGLFGHATFCCEERKALVAPRTALVERGQLTGIYVVDPQGIARLRVVTPGRTFGEMVEILSGASEGDRIVIHPQGRPLEGKKVSVAP